MGLDAITAPGRCAWRPTLIARTAGGDGIKELLGDIERWRSEGGPVALARLIRTSGSAPRAPGAAMVVNGDGRVAGSLSGGCVEGAVVSEALEVLRDGRAKLVTFGYSDAEAFAVGLTCGGSIEVLITPELFSFELELEAELRAGNPVVVATVVELAPSEDVGDERDPLAFRPDIDEAELRQPSQTAIGMAMLVRDDLSVLGSLGQPSLDAVVARDAVGAMRAARSGERNYGLRGEARGRSVQVFFDVFSPPPKMVIFGAVDFTAALAKVAKVLGYRVAVCDARATFATRERFPMADEVVAEWPQRYLEREGATLGRRDACCVLTHDPKFDVPAILAALATDVGYLGAMGSRRTHEDRMDRLRAAGCTSEQLSRLMAPIGLAIGARTPEETAISILAEIIATQTGSEPRSLKETSGPIHAALETTVAR